MVKWRREYLYNNINVPYQSAYKAGRSKETALLTDYSDILHYIKSKNNVILLLLDLNNAFDTVKHSIFLDRRSE